MTRQILLALTLACTATILWAQSPGADDAALQKLVQQQLASDPAFAGVHPETHNGKVTLTGSVATKQDRNHAEDMVKSVPGVKSVKDRLRVTTGQAVAPSAPVHEGVAASTAPAAGSGATSGTAGSSSDIGNSGSGGANRAPSKTGPTNPNQPTAPQGR